MRIDPLAPHEVVGALPFIGRDYELRCLEDALMAARTGNGGLILIVGPPGSGKSRLVSEFVRRARERGSRPAALGFPPRYADVRPDALADFLSTEFPQTPWSPRSVAADATRPDVLIVEDMQIATNAVKAAIASFANDAAKRGLLTVATFSCRRDANHAWRRAVDKLAHLSRFPLLFLEGWAESETGLAVEYSGLADRCGGVDLIHAISGGNPGYVAELLRSLPDGSTQGGAADPLACFEAPIRRHIRSLSRECQDVVRFSSLFQHQWSLRTLIAVFPGQSTHDLVGVVDEALEAHVFAEVQETGVYRFCHPLVQSVISGEISSTRQAHLHGLIAARLRADEKEHGRVDSAILAHHYSRAAAISPTFAGPALDYQLAAATDAERIGDWLTASERYAAARDLLNPAKREDEEGDVLCRLARSQRNGGARGEAWRTAVWAIEWFQQRHDAEGVARATLLATRVPASPERHSRMLLAALDALSDEPGADAERANLLVQLSVLDGVPQATRDTALRGATELAGTAKSAEVDVRVAFAQAVHRSRKSLEDGVYHDSVSSDLEAAHRRLTAYGYLEDAFDAVGLAGHYEAWWGLLQRAEQHANLLIEYRQRVGLAFGRGHPEVLAATLLWLRGDLPGFEEMSKRLHPDILDASLFPMQHLEFRGDIQAAIALMPDARIAREVPTLLAFLLGSRARVWMNAGEHARSRAELNVWLQVVGKLGTAEQGARLAGLADVLTAVADDETIRAAYRLASISRLAWDRSLGVTAERGRGDLALRLGMLGQAERHYRRALTWCDRERVPVEGAWCQLGLARVAGFHGNETLASVRLATAAERFRIYGAALGEAAIRNLSAEIGIGATPLAVPLTPREAEVLRLLAAGRTNDEIAEILVISRNTVANHVSHILAKTGARNRTSAAAIAFQLGLE